MIEAIGWLSGICFALSSLPFAYQAVKTGNADAPWSTVLLILFGMYGMLVYESATAAQIPQLVDFTCGVFGWSTVAIVKLRAYYVHTFSGRVRR